MRKKDFFYLLLIFSTLLAVFFDLFTLKQAFLSGDHMEQQYPWAKFYQDQIRQFALPWWTSAIHCGFPLLAEGQVGAFYPLNFLFFFFLPAKIAYNGIILFQYLLGGILFYAYLRRQRLSAAACFFAALIWLFGSMQGGYFYYNYISQKVVIWLPLILLLTDRLLERRKFSDAFFLSLLFAVQIFGGYLQVAVYSLLFSGFYFLFFWFRERKIKLLLFYAAAGALGIFYSLIQVLPTFELSLMSSRAGAVKEIAYLGSMNPLGIATLIFPSWDGFLGSELYIGLLGLFFLFHSLTILKESKVRFFWLAAVLFLFFAMGKYTPVYRAVIEITHFYSFRTPFKFLFFVGFCGAVLAAFGFDAFFEKKAARQYRFLFPANSVFAALLGVSALGVPVLHKILTAVRPEAVSRLQAHVREHIYGAPGHPYSLDYYMEKSVGFYDAILQLVNVKDPYTGLQIILISVSAVYVALMLRAASRGDFRWTRPACAALLFLDLFLYGFTSIRANFLPFDLVDKPRQSALVGKVLEDKSHFRVMEVYTSAGENSLFPFYPSTNMLIGVDDLGAYSPLALKKYADFLEGWGYVNDSLSNRWVDPALIPGKLADLGILNVKYLFSGKEIQSDSVALLAREGSVFLYENKLWAPRAFFLSGAGTLSRLSEIKRESALPVLIESYQQQKVSLQVEAPSSGVLFLSDLCYLGWQADVNGKKTEIQCVDGLFRAVPLPAGAHRITFRYSPEKYRLLGMASIILISGIGAALYWGKLRRRRSEV